MGRTGHLGRQAKCPDQFGNNCKHQQQVNWVQVYPPDQFSALFAPLSRPGCADKSLVTMGVTIVTSGP